MNPLNLTPFIPVLAEHKPAVLGSPIEARINNPSTEAGALYT